MDPSSFASAAASLLGVTIQVTGFLYGDWDRSSQTVAERLIFQLSQLRNVLQSLELTALSMTEAVVVSKVLLTHLEELKDILIGLGSRLLEQNRHALFSFSDYELPWRSINAPRPLEATKLPLTSAEAFKAVQDLQLCISKLTKSIDESPFSASDVLLQNYATIPSESLWKDSAEYANAHDYARWLRLDGTGEWFRNNPAFRRWLSAERNSSNMLFCPGTAGSGKTILTSLAIDEVRRLQQQKKFSNMGLAYFYFSYKTPAPIRSIALALLEQLCLQSSKPLEEMSKFESGAVDLERLTFSQVVSTLLAVSKTFAKTYIIFDALDECPPSYQSELLYLLSSIRDSPCRLFASSRPRHDLDGFDTNLEIKIVPSEGDLRHYANTKLQDSPILFHDEVMFKDVVNALVEQGKSHNMFLPVVLQVNAILDKITAEEIRMQLRELPRDLQAFYQNTLQRVLNQERHIADLARLTLTWLFYAQRPLQSKELLQVYDFWRSHKDPGGLESPEVDTSLVVKACMGLVQPGQTITFVHFSVKEYLDMSLVGGDEGMVAALCMQFILHRSRLRSTYDTEAVEAEIERMPLLLYAASYWGDHLRNALQNRNIDREKLLSSCSALLTDSKIIASLCHIRFDSLPRSPSQVRGIQLVKSSWLHLAAVFGLEWPIEEVTQKIARSDILDEWRRTPLHLAAEKGFSECVSLLLDHTRMQWNQRDIFDRSVWHYAAMSGSLGTIGHLIDFISEDANSHGQVSQSVLGVDKQGRSPLEYAALNGDVEAFQWVLRLYPAKSSKRFQIKAFKTALNGFKVRILEILLAQGIVPTYEDLLDATRAGFEEAVQLLLDYGTKVDNPDANSDSALLIAAREGRNRILQFLIWNGAEIDRVGRTGLTALSSAVQVGNVEGVQMMRQAGADQTVLINKTDKLSVYAARLGFVEIVRLLSPEAKERTEAAFAAVANGHLEVLRLLLDSGIPADSKSDDGQDLLEVAREGGHNAIVDLLHSYGPNVFPRVVYSISTKDVINQKRLSVDPLTEIKESDIRSVRSEDALSPAQSRNHSNMDFPVENTATSVDLVPSKMKQVRPMSLQRLSDSGFRTVRSVNLKNGQVPFAFLSEPFRTDNLRLGSIVVDPKEPLKWYAPADKHLLSELVEHSSSKIVQSDYNLAIERRSTNNIAFEVLRPLFKTGVNHAESIKVAASKVVRLQLHNHESYLSAILTRNEIRDEFLNMARLTSKKDLFLVVGMLVADTLQTQISRETSNDEAALRDIGSASAMQTEMKHEGDGIIFAVSYRTVKIRNRGFLRNLTTRGSASGTSDITLDDYYTPKGALM